MALFNTTHSRRGRIKAPPGDQAQGHGYFVLNLPKEGPLRRAWNRWRTVRKTKRTARKGKPMDPMVDHVSAKADADFRTLSATTEAETAVRRELYQDAAKKHRNHDQVITDQLEVVQEWKAKRIADADTAKEFSLAVIDDEEARTETALDQVNERIGKQAEKLEISPESDALPTKFPWVLPVLAVIAVADWFGIASTLSVLGLSKFEANVMAFFYGIVITFCAHAVGKFLRHRKAKDVVAAVAISIPPLVGVIGLASLRAEFLAANTNLDVTSMHVVTLAAFMVGGFIAGVIVGFLGTVRELNLVHAFNKSVRHRSALHHILRQIPGRRTEVGEVHSQMLTKIHEESTSAWEAVVRETSDRLAAEYEIAARNYYHLEKAVDEVKKGHQAKLDAKIAWLEANYQLAGGKLEKPTETASSNGVSSHPHRAARVASVLAMALVMLFASGCEAITGGTPAQETELIVLHDRSTSFLDPATQLYTDAELLNLAEIDTVGERVYNGLKFTGSIIDGAFVSRSFHNQLPASPPGENIFLRKDRVKEWYPTFRYALNLHIVPAQSDATNVIDPLAEALTQLVESESDRKILLLVSDMVHCETGGLCLSGSSTYADLVADPSKVEDQIEAVAPLPDDLEGIEIILLTAVESSAESQELRTIIRFWKRLFVDRGAGVRVMTNLPEVPTKKYLLP